MKCPTCEGRGKWVEFCSPETGTSYSDCGHCDKTGEVTLWQFITYTFWQHCPNWLFDLYVEITFVEDSHQEENREEDSHG